VSNLTHVYPTIHGFILPTLVTAYNPSKNSLYFPSLEPLCLESFSLISFPISSSSGAISDSLESSMKVEIGFTYSIYTIDEMYFLPTLHKISQNVVQESLNCNISMNNCAYKLYLKIGAMVHECFDTETSLGNCAYITNIITLMQPDDIPISTIGQDIIRAKVVNALKTAVQINGQIHTLLNHLN